MIFGVPSNRSHSMICHDTGKHIHSKNLFHNVVMFDCFKFEMFFLLFLSLKIQVPLWMAGKTCGICGKYDAECEQEYRMPNGYLAKNAVSFGHSWILEEAPCRGGRQIALSSQHLIHQEIRWG